LIPEILVFLLLGGVVGFSIGLTSIGGAVFLLPVLTVAMGFAPSVAVGTASLYSSLTKIYACVRHYRLDHIDFATARLFLLGAVPGNLIVAVAINRYLDHHGAAQIDAFQAHLKLTIIGFILLSVLLMIINLVRTRKTDAAQGETESYRPNTIATLFVGLAVGCVIGATAISAVVVVPTMILFFRLSARHTVGTTVFAGLVLTLLTAVVYIAGGQIQWAAALWMALGSGAGVYFGSRLTSRIPERPLKATVIVLVAIAALLMIFA
jgi:uncharacterized membrane protein YfcA